jgi:competence CoiA-like predicted nuclease
MGKEDSRTIEIKMKIEVEKENQRIEKEKQRKQNLEIFRGEYMDYCCPSCDGKFKIVYTKWSTTHFAKSICENCDKFDRWLPHPKPDNEFK